jgi:hypothetical protein
LEERSTGSAKKADIIDLVEEKNAWVTMRSSISREVNCLRKKVIDQVQAKMADLQRKEEIKGKKTNKVV